MEHVDMDSLLSKYFVDGDWRGMDQQGNGMNNTTRFVLACGERYVLRIYETHRDEDKVRYEHAVLLRLAEQRFSFGTPVLVRAKNGETFVYTTEGKLAALFRYQEGVRPTLLDGTSWRDFGEVVASLSLALAYVYIEANPAYRPYYEIEHTHPRCSLEHALQFCLQPPPGFNSEELTQRLQYIGECLEEVEKKLPRIKMLPHQLIHGDINASNLLADRGTGKITAVLDFEFVTWDLRVMELAVCLSDLIDPEEDLVSMWDKIKAILVGYGRIIELTTAEIQALPTLIMLRRLDVLIHFLGRYWDGVDKMEVVKRQIHNAYSMALWLGKHEDKLLDAFKDDNLACLTI